MADFVWRINGESNMAGPKIDEIGPWSEVKLDILKRYAVEYSKILSSQKSPSFFHVYIDAFAGTGYHLSETTGEMVLGSPLNALLVRPPFREYHFVDLDGDKIDGLAKIIGNRPDVFLHKGDCNQVLLREVFPRVLREDFKRGLCLLDPYGLTLDWKTILKAGPWNRSTSLSTFRFMTSTSTSCIMILPQSCRCILNG